MRRSPARIRGRGPSATATQQLRPLPESVMRGVFGARVPPVYRRLHTAGVHGDGSCFYHSLAMALGKLSPGQTKLYSQMSEEEQKSLVYKFRCDLAKEYDRSAHRRLESDMRSESPKFEVVREKMCQPRTWADEIMIRHVMKQLDINILFFNFETGTLYCNVHGDDPLRQKTILIAWIRNSHFEPVVLKLDDGPIGPGKVSRIRTVFDPSKREIDRRLVQDLFRSHGAECAVPKRATR